IERIIFPIVSEIDRTVGFSGRIFTNREVPDSVPKYLNSPATPVYNKSKLLYGFNKSKPAIKKSKSTFIVEGYMDFLMLYQSGVKNIVAVAGTALTTPHLEKLRRITDTIILSFDNDLGGLRALESAMDNFSSFDFHVKTLNLGKYKDPAEAIQEDLEFFKQAISSTEPAFRYLFKRYLGRQDEMDVREKKKTVRHLIKKISKLDSVVEQDIWLKELSEKAKISEEAIKSELDDLVSNSKKKDTQKKKEDQVKPTARDRIDSIIEKILSLAFTNDSFLPIVKDNRDIFPDKYKDLIDNPKGEDSKLLDLHSSYLSSSMDEKSLNEEFEILMKFLKLDYLEKKRSQFQDFMRKADSEEELKKAVGKFNEVSIKIDNLKKGKIKPF
ncbi:MAG: toprim domain-containing protein, partial [Candidatus Paceibacterota bacterium]